MVLSIKNINKSLEGKINKCIALLDDEYRSLDFTIDFYKNRERLEYECKNKPEMDENQYRQILSGQIEAAGITLGDRKKIKIFLFFFSNVEQKPKEIIDLIGNLYHEIRHAYQAKNNLFQDEKEITTIDGNIEEYYSLPSEIDAYKFQLEQMQKNADKVLEIFNRSERLLAPYTLKDEIMKYLNT